ncbi:MAG: hypothetical protein MAG715_00335 [Methanonatronarchaeales archaeon]|nr:hypothetical protein [Methanonatronarchaeales archaeon]
MFSERKVSILRGLREEHLLAVLMTAILAVGGCG